MGPEGKILLVRSNKWKDKYVIIGGHIELGERIEDALRREVKEETGLEISSIRKIGTAEILFDPDFHEKRHFISFDFLCQASSTEVILNHEAQSYVWVKPEDVLQYDLPSCTRKTLEICLKLLTSSSS